MSRREDIDNAIWQDAEFDALSNDAQLLYLWSFTNPRCGMGGIYKVAERQVLEGRLSKQALGKALAELAERRFAFYHEGVLWIRSRVRHLRTHTQQIARSIMTDLEKVGLSHPLAIAFCEENRGGWLEAHATLPRTSPEVQQSPEVSQFLNLNRPSTEVPLNLQGKGSGKGTDTATSTESRDEADTIRSLCDYWRETCGHPDAKIKVGDERWSKVRARLRDGYTPDQIRCAIDGAAKAPYTNDRGKRYDDLELICRNKVKLEDFMSRAQGVTALHKPRRKVDVPKRIGELIAKGVDQESARSQAEYEAEKVAGA